MKINTNYFRFCISQIVKKNLGYKFKHKEDEEKYTNAENIYNELSGMIFLGKPDEKGIVEISDNWKQDLQNNYDLSKINAAINVNNMRKARAFKQDLIKQNITAAANSMSELSEKASDAAKSLAVFTESVEASTSAAAAATARAELPKTIIS